MKRHIWALFFVVLCLVGGGCQGKPPLKNKVALVIPLSGPLAPWGKACKQAVTLELNSKKRTLQLAVFDNQGEVGKTKQIFKSLSNDREILAVIGPLQCRCLEGVLPIIKKAQMPVVSPGCFQKFPQSQGWVVPLLSTEDQADEIAAFLNKNHFKWAIFWEKTPWAEALNKYLRQRVVLAPVFNYALKTKDISSVLSHLKEKRPRAIVCISNPVTGGLIISQIRNAGLDPYFLGPFCFSDPEFKKITYGVSKKILIPIPVLPEKWQKEFKRQFLLHYYLNPNWIAINTYAIIKTIITAPRLDRKTLKKHLKDTKILQFRLRPLVQE